MKIIHFNLVLVCGLHVAMFSIALPVSVPEYVMPVSVDRSIERECHLWSAEGVASFERGDNMAAVQSFTVASHQHSANGAIWSNLALALASLANEELPAEEEMSNELCRSSLAKLCEAKAAVALGEGLGHTNQALLDSLQQMEAYLGARADGASCADIGRGAALRTLDVALGEPDAAAACALLCSEQNLVLRLSTAERARGILTATTLRLAWGLMRVCGVLVVEDLLDPSLLATVAEAQASFHDTNVSARAAELYAAGKESDAVVAIRGSMARLEARLPMTAPFVDEGLISSPFALSLLRMWLGGDGFEIDTFSYIQSAPGSPAQKWHADLEGLFHQVG